MFVILLLNLVYPLECDQSHAFNFTGIYELPVIQLVSISDLNHEICMVYRAEGEIERICSPKSDGFFFASFGFVWNSFHIILKFRVCFVDFIENFKYYMSKHRIGERSTHYYEGVIEDETIVLE